MSGSDCPVPCHCILVTFNISSNLMVKEQYNSIWSNDRAKI